MKKHRTIILFFFCLLSVVAAAPSDNGEVGVQKPTGFLLKGVLIDSLFAQSDSVVVEVLESDTVFSALFGKEFQVELPIDTLWNICFSDSSEEKCYEILYLGVDSVFEHSIGGDVKNQVLFDNTLEDIALEIATDTTTPGLDSAEVEEDLESDVTQIINKRTKLRKTIVRLRKRPKRALGKTTISAKSIKRMPSLAEADVIKSIQALPGVVASSDFSSKLYVRGAGADQNLFLFDNAVVYSPIHFFGLFSTFLVEGIDEVNFYKGGFSPEYGNRLSSVVDIKSRVGGNDSTNSYLEGSSIKISTFASQVHHEGRHNDFRWLLAGRATYFKTMIDFFRWAGVTDLKIDYGFWDVQGSFNYEFSKKQNLKFSFYKGEDNLIFTPLLASWGNTVYALNYSHSDLITDWDLLLTASYSDFFQTFEFEDISRFKNSIASDGLKAYKATAHYDGFKNNVFMTGIESQNISTTFKQEFLIAENDPADDDTTNTDSTSAQDAVQEAAQGQQDDNLYNFWLHSWFVSNAYTWGDLTVTPGVRVNFHSDLEEFYWEPRISFQYLLPGRQTLDLHLGHYKQFVNSLNFSDQESLNEFYYPTKMTKFQSMKPSESDLFSIGYHNPGIFGLLDLTLESYYKVFHNLYVFDFNGAPEEIKQSTQADIGDYFKMGEGYSYGFEAMVRKNEGLAFGGISYSYGKSILQDLDEDATAFQKDSAAYPANWDQTHSIKIDFGINWRGEDGIWSYAKGKYLRSSVAIKLASGLPFPAVAGYAPSHLRDQGNAMEVGGPPVTFDNNISTPLAARNQSRYPWYRRIDIKVLDIGVTGKWSLSYTIINLLDDENIWFYTYDKSSNPPVRDKQTQLPFLPVMVNFEYFF